MKVSVIVPTHNRADALEKTLSFLSRQVFDHAWEVIVVNNNCSDNTDEVVQAQMQKFPVPLILVHEQKPGAAAARNAGAWKAQGEYLVFIDNDILTEPDFIKRHFDDLEKYKGSWFVGNVHNLPEQEKTHFGKFRKSLEAVASDKITEVNGITGQTTSLPREQFIQLNGFDESFHVASGEDRELALRALKKGIRIYFDPAIVVLHNDWAGTSIKDYCKRQRTYTITEPFFWQKYGNETPRLKMVKENLPPSLKEDGLKLYCWKLTKGMLGSKTGQSIIVGLCNVCEKIFPKPVVLWKLYRLAIAGSIYKGFNEGLAIFSIKERKLSAAIQ
ncbi:MAG TPA: glycosyltransferase [Chitinophagaceae bacterium]